jgi:hypothetical protein
MHPDPIDPHASVGRLIEAFEEVLDLRILHGLGRLVDVHHHGPLEVSDGAGDHRRRAAWRCLRFVWLSPPTPPTCRLLGSIDRRRCADPAAPTRPVFVTIEDETGIANLIVWPEIVGRSRRAASASPIALHRIGRELTKPRKRMPTIVGVGCGS